MLEKYKIEFEAKKVYVTVTIRPTPVFHPLIILSLVTLTACTGDSTPTIPSGPVSTRVSEIDGMEQVYVTP